MWFCFYAKPSDGEFGVEKSININKQKRRKIMFKYDEVISTLALVNTLARDPDYGNIKQVNCDCDIENSQNIYLKTEQDCEFRLKIAIFIIRFLMWKNFCYLNCL